MITRTLAQPGHYEHLAHGDLSDMPDVPGTNSDHDARYLQDAPDDGTMYGRMNGAWERITLFPPVADWWDPTGGLPVAPEVGDRYAADGSGSGWTDGYIYEWDGEDWIETEVSGEADWGMMIWVIAEIMFYVFASGGWEEVGSDSYWSVWDSQSGLEGDKSGDFNLTTTGNGNFANLESTNMPTVGGVSLLDVFTYSTTFDNSDLTAGVLTVTHALNTLNCSVVLYNNVSNIIFPDEITTTDVNTISVDLSSYGAITGDWLVVIISTGNGGGNVAKLATVTGIDAKTVAATTLYTVPAGKQCVLTDAFLRCTEATAITIVAGGSIGANATDYNDFIGNYILGSNTSVNQVSSVINGMGMNNTSVVYQAGDIIKLNITTGATGTSQTIAVDLFGYLI